MDDNLNSFISYNNSQSDCDCDCACLTTNDATSRFSKPPFYYLELTSTCNSQCRGCGNVFLDDQSSRQVLGKIPHLGTDEWIDVLSNLIPHAQKFNITGGEATLHPGFYDIVQYIAERGVPFTVFTNGCWNKPEELVNFLSVIPQCQGLLISLHGPDSNTHAIFSGSSDNFNTIIANIMLARQVNLRVSLSTVLTEENWNRIDDMLLLGRRLDVSKIVFNRYIGRYISGLTPTSNHLRQAILVIERFKQQGDLVKFGPCIPLCFVRSSATGCAAGKQFVTIDPWANVKPCNHTPLILGNLLTESIERIWNSSTLINWTNQIPKSCTRCFEYKRCQGGCRALALLNTKLRDPLAVQSISKYSLIPMN